MDVRSRQFLTNEQQLELKEWEKLFEMPAYKWLVEDHANQEQALTDFIIRSAATADQMWTARGQISVHKYVQSLEAIIEDSYNQMTEAAGLTAAELEESRGANS